MSLLAGFVIVGCGDDDDSADTTPVENAEAAEEGTEAAEEGTEAAEEGTEDTGETDPETDLISLCQAACEQEFGACQDGAPEGWYDYEYPEDDWPQDKDSCLAFCESDIPGKVAKGQSCVDYLEGSLNCRTSLNCDELWEWMDGNEPGHCAEFENDSACEDEE